MNKDIKKENKVVPPKKKAFLSQYSTGIYLIVDPRPELINLIYVRKFKDHSEIIDVYHRIIPQDKDQMQFVLDCIVEFRLKSSITKENVILNLSAKNDISIATLIFPVMNPQELASAARIQLTEDVAFNLDKAEIYPEILYHFKDQNDQEKIRAILYVVNQETLEKYISITEKLQLNLVGISTDGLNYPYFANLNSDKQNIYCVLNIDYKEATLYFYTGKKLLFVRPIAYSWEKIIKALMGSVALPDGKVDLALEDVHEFNQTIGLLQNETVKFKDKIPYQQMMSLIRPLLELVIRELKYSLRYFDLNFENRKIEILYLTGGGASLKNLDQFLREALELNVVPLKLSAGIDDKKSKSIVNDHNLNLMASSLGSIVHTKESLNFIPKEIKNKKAVFWQKWTLILIFVVSLSILLVVLFLQNQEIRKLENNIKTDKQFFSSLQNVVSAQEEVLEEKKLMAAIRKKEIFPEGILLVLSDKIPDEVQLDLIFIQRSNYLLRVTGNVLGESLKAEKVLNDFLKELKGIAFFSDISLVFSQRKDSVLIFEIKAALAHE